MQTPREYESRLGWKVRRLGAWPFHTISALYWNASQFRQDIYSSCLGKQREAMSLPQPIPEARHAYCVAEIQGEEMDFLLNMFLTFTFILKDWRMPDPISLSTSFQPVLDVYISVSPAPSRAGDLYYCITCQREKCPLLPRLFPWTDWAHRTGQASANYSYGVAHCAPKIIQ